MPVIQPQKPFEAHPATAAPPRGEPARVLGAAAFAAAIAWLSQGTLAPGPGLQRLGLLPLTLPAILLSLGVGIAVAALRRAGAALAPLLLLALPLLAWLPIPVPPIVLTWSGPIVLAIWAAVLVLMLRPATRPLAFRTPRPVLAAGVAALAIHSAAAWSVAPSLPKGDEPHYLIITQSLLLDHDLKIENNHKRGDYRAYFGGDLTKPDYYRRGRDGEIYSIHAPGVSALVAPAFAAAGYHGVLAFLLLISASTAALAWYLAHQVTGRPDAAWFGWAAVVLSPPMLLNAFTVYPDGPGGLLVLTGLWALVRSRQERTNGAESIRPWFLHGLALAMLPWLHTRFALLAGGIGALVLLDLSRTRNPAAKASAFLAAPTLSALAWIAFFVAIYGAPDPAIPYRGSDLGAPSYIAGGLGGLFFDQMYGLLPAAPVLALAGGGLIALARRPGLYRFLPLQLTFIAAPYVLTVTHFAMWWGGLSAPARFLVPLVPAMAIPVAAARAAATRAGTRAAMAAALGATAFISAVLAVVDRGRLAYFARDNIYSPWIEWANRAIDLVHGLPAFFARVQRGQPGWLFFAEAAVWIGAVLLGWAVLRRFDGVRWLRSPVRMHTAAVLVLSLAAMAAVSMVWRLEGASGRSPASAAMDLLRRQGSVERSLALDVDRWRPIDGDALTGRLRIRLERTPPRGQGQPRESRDLFTLPLVPAGDYRLRAEQAAAAGWLMVGVGRDQFALVTEPASAFAPGIDVHLPVDVRSLVVRGDEDALQQVRALVVQPLRVLRTDQKVSQDLARRAVRYGAATVFFMDDRSFAEPGAFWIGGGVRSSVVFQPDAPRAFVRLRVKNAPVENVLKVTVGSWHDERRLAAGEEGQIDVPLDAARRATPIGLETSAGFRPSAADPSSRDDRLLGVSVRIE